jgi:hypothetical protein
MTKKVQLVLDVNYGDYSYLDSSDIKMTLLGHFFADEVACRYRMFFRNWAAKGSDGDYCSGNITGLEIEGDDIVMTDLYPEMPGDLRIKREQFIKLFDERLEKVCKIKPQEVIIFNDNDRFWIETKE